MRVIPILTALSLSVLACAQDETVVRELRLSIGSMPAMTEATEETSVSGTPITNEFEVDGSSGANLGLGVSFLRYKGKVGYGAYIGGFVRSASADDDLGTTMSMTSLGLDLGLDLAVRPTQNLTLTVGPRLGLGLSNQSIDSPVYKDATGTYLSIAAQVGAYFAITERVSIGLEAGAMGWLSKATHDYDDGVFAGTVDETVEGSGGYGALVLGITF